VLLVTYTVKPLLVPSYLMVVVPAMALVAAAGIVRFADRRVAGVAGAVLLAACLLGLVRYHRQDSQEEWRQAVASVLADAAPGDGLVAVPTQSGGAVDYYVRHGDGPPLESLSPSIEDPPGPAVLWEIERNAPGPHEMPDWDPLQTYDRWVDEHYRLDEERSFERVVVRRWERR
jgi:hypothetical protein